MNQSFDVDLAEFAVSLTAAGCTYRTVTERVGAIRHIGKYLAADPRDCNLEQITRWLGRPGLSKNSRATYWGHAAVFYRWLWATGRTPENRMAGSARPRAMKGLPRPLPPLIVDQALNAATGRTHTYLLLALYAGLRAHEVAKIRGEHISQTDLFVHGKGDRDDTIPTHPILWTAAQSYPRAGWWFPTDSTYGHVCATTVTTMVRRLFRSIGYDGHLHQARHSYGTNVLRAAGGNARVAQQLLRHASLTTTALYTQVEDDERRAAINRLSA